MLGFFCTFDYMKVKLIKDHLYGKAGDVVDVTKEQANYFIRCSIAKEHKETVKAKK